MRSNLQYHHFGTLMVNASQLDQRLFWSIKIDSIEDKS